jgi:hypothetical protein
MYISKTSLDIMEVALFKLQKQSSIMPNIEVDKTGERLELDNSRQSVDDCIWTVNNGITSIYKNGEQIEAFSRNFICARALWGIVSYLPNMMGLGPDARAVEYNASSYGFEKALVAYTTNFPISKTSMAIILEDVNVPFYSICSMYSQVISAVVFANKHASFSHNLLTPLNVWASPAASIFTINYENHGLVCFNNIMVITNYKHAQFSYVNQNGGIIHFPPMSETSAVNLVPHVSSDIYRFTSDCYTITSKILGNMSRLEAAYMEYSRRVDFFKTMLAFYLDKNGEKQMTMNVHNLTSRPTNIAPYSDGISFVNYLKKVLDSKDINIFYQTPRLYKNMHLSAIHFKISTWYTADLRSLVAFDLPKISDRTLQDIGHVEYMCSEIVDDLLNKPDLSIDDVRRISVEIPTFLVLDLKKLLQNIEISNWYAAESDKIMNRNVYGNLTFRNILSIK